MLGEDLSFRGANGYANLRKAKLWRQVTTLPNSAMEPFPARTV
jgi:hypothetical protein